jgi:hypothetical protein
VESHQQNEKDHHHLIVKNDLASIGVKVGKHGLKRFLWFLFTWHGRSRWFVAHWMGSNEKIGTMA